VNDDVNKRTVNLWIVAVAAGGSSLVQPADTAGYSLVIKCDYTAFTSLVLTPTNSDYVLLQPNGVLTGQIIEYQIKSDDTEPREVLAADAWLTARSMRPYFNFTAAKTSD